MSQDLYIRTILGFISGSNRTPFLLLLTWLLWLYRRFCVVWLGENSLCFLRQKFYEISCSSLCNYSTQDKQFKTFLMYNVGLKTTVHTHTHICRHSRIAEWQLSSQLAEERTVPVASWRWCCVSGETSPKENSVWCLNKKLTGSRSSVCRDML